MGFCGDALMDSVDFAVWFSAVTASDGIPAGVFSDFENLTTVLESEMSLKFRTETLFCLVKFH